MERYIERPELDFLSDKSSANVFDDFFLIFVESVIRQMDGLRDSKGFGGQPILSSIYGHIQRQDIDFIASRVRGELDTGWIRGL